MAFEKMTILLELDLRLSVTENLSQIWKLDLWPGEFLSIQLACSWQRRRTWWVSSFVLAWAMFGEDQGRLSSPFILTVVLGPACQHNLVAYEKGTPTAQSQQHFWGWGQRIWVFTSSPGELMFTQVWEPLASVSGTNCQPAIDGWWLCLDGFLSANERSVAIVLSSFDWKSGPSCWFLLPFLHNISQYLGQNYGAPYIDIDLRWQLFF